MAVLIMETDAFEEAFAKRKESAAGLMANPLTAGSYAQAFRRPLGLVPKYPDSPSPAYIMVTDAQGNTIPIYDDPGARDGVKNPSASAWRAFSLQSVDETRREKIQLIETFGEAYTFFYGEHARVLNCSGVLVNSESHNWRALFWQNYDEFFRGTRLVERNARIYLTWDDIIVQGYMLSAQARETAGDPHMIPFNFSLLVIRYDNIAMSTVSKGEMAEGERKSGSDRIAVEKALASRNVEFNALLPTAGQRKALEDALRASGVKDEQISGILQAESSSPLLLNRLAQLQSERGFLSRFGDALLSQVSVSDMINMGKGLLDSKRRGGVLANMGITALGAAEQAGSGAAGAALPLAIGAKGMTTIGGMGLAEASGETFRGMFGYDSDKGEYTPSAFMAGAGSIGAAGVQDANGTTPIG